MAVLLQYVVQYRSALDDKVCPTQQDQFNIMILAYRDKKMTLIPQGRRAVIPSNSVMGRCTKTGRLMRSGTVGTFLVLILSSLIKTHKPARPR